VTLQCSARMSGLPFPIGHIPFAPLSSMIVLIVNNVRVPIFASIAPAGQMLADIRELI
jgi:hypothetical protein